VRENLDDITGQLADALPDPGEPELPDGFVGIVGGTVPASEAEDDEDADAEDQPDDEVAAVEPDDTVAPMSETEADIEGVDAAVDEPAEPDEADEVDDDVVEVADEVEADVPDDHEVTELEADEADAHAPGSGGDVDELFARLRAEREESVAKARQVVETDAASETDTDADTEVDGAADARTDEVAEPADAVAPDDVGDGEQAEDAQADDRAGGDVDRVPAEFLAEEEALTARADALGPLETKLNRALKRRLADEQNELLDLLRRSGITTAAELLPELSVQVDGYARLAEKHLLVAAAAGSQAAGGDVTVDVSAQAQALGAALVEPFRRRVERSASEVDGDPDELDERLRALYREWKVQHIGPVADDALLSAYALGTLTAAEPDGRVSWRIDPSQGPCPDAQDNALAGEVGAGEPFPTGDSCPQAHPGCRCLLVIS